MKKIMLTTLLALMSSQSFAVNLTTQGNATTTMTLHAPAAWSITKGVEGEGTLGEGNIFEGNDSLNHIPTLIIKNNTATAGKYYLRGNGDSKGENGTILYVKRGDKSQTFEVINMRSESDTDWDSTDEVYKSQHPLPAGGTKTILLTTYPEIEVEPGVYDVSLELLTETP